MARQEPITATDFTFRAVFEPAAEGGYVVTFPAIPDLATQGETIDEAREMAEDCLRCYLEGLKKDGVPLPESEHDQRRRIRSSVTVKIPAEV